MSRRILARSVLAGAILLLGQPRPETFADSTPGCQLAQLARGRECRPVSLRWTGNLADRQRSETARGPRAQRIAQGLKVSIMVPRRSYPQDALIRVTLGIQNVSHHDVWVEAGGPPFPGETFPQIEVLNDAGSVEYPPAVAGYLPAPGPPPIAERIPPGERARRHALVVLYASHLRAIVTVLRSQVDPYHAAGVTTPLVTVHLTASHPPGVILMHTGSQLNATIEPGAGMHGPLRFVDAVLCQGSGSGGHYFWTRSKNQFSPGCATVETRHFVAGWLNHSVAVLNYTTSP